jgi:hypothetical protein
MTRQLRSARGTNGLILANGGVATYQHVLILSRNPRVDNSPYPTTNPLPETLTAEYPSPAIAENPEGEAIIEVGFLSPPSRSLSPSLHLLTPSP